MSNVDFVKEVYSNFSTGNVEAVLAAFDPQIEWRECKGMPFVDDDGIYSGPQEVVENVFMHIPAFIEGFGIEPIEIFGADDKVVMMGYYVGKNIATGNTFKANETHVWTITGGKLSHFFQAVDSATINK